mmetsp:Transcript_74713/g.192821  ORF Transcript_74713/g.192821 Transcript_74713/m.192821 type:complete len:363 (+) Transcript_74713:194-1282(+)
MTYAGLLTFQQLRPQLLQPALARSTGSTWCPMGLAGPQPMLRGQAGPVVKSDSLGSLRSRLHDVGSSLDPLQGQIYLRRTNGQGGCDPQHVALAGGEHQQAKVLASLEDGAAACDIREDNPIQQALSAHGVPPRLVDLPKPCPQALAHLIHVLEEGRVSHLADSVVGAGADEWCAGECAAMIARADHVGHLLRHEHGADGQAGGEGLGHGHHVRRHPGDLVAPQLAGPPEAALHLVEDEHGADLVAPLPQRLHELGGGRNNAALALHRLHEDCARLLIDGLQASRLIELQELNRRHDRLEGRLVVLLPREGQGTHRAPMEGVLESDELLAWLLIHVVELAGKLDGRLVRLRSRVAEESLVGE